MTQTRLRKLSWLFALATLLFGSVPVSAQEDDVLDAAEARRRAVAQKMEAATFWILATDESPGVSMGTGFHIGNDYIVTNQHVIIDKLGGDYLIVNSKIAPTSATLVAYFNPVDSNGDLALLKLDTPLPADWPSLSFAGEVNRMDRVSSWGYPSLLIDKDQQFEQFFNIREVIEPPPVVYSEGVVNSVVKNPAPQVLHSADISGGNSGGPLVNSRGEVVGINTFIFRDDFRTVNAALHLEQIIDFLKDNGVEYRLGSRQDSILANEEQPAAPSSPDSQNDRLAALRQEAEAGGPDDKYTLGYTLAFGSDDISVDAEESEKWLRAAIDAGSADAKALLGYILIVRPDDPDPIEGLELFTTGVADGADVAYKGRLALLHYFGEPLGIPFDPAESLRLAEAAADEENDDGIAMLAMHYYSGGEIEPDHKQALRLARMAYKKADNATAKALLAHLYYDGNVVTQDLAKALEFAQEAGEANVGLAQGLLAFMCADGTEVEQDYDAAAAWGQRAAEQADPFGQYLLGKLYLEGNGVEQDLAKAWMYLTMARQKVSYDLDELIEKTEEQMTIRQLKEAQQMYVDQYEAWGLAVE